jgi:hypothetical protein
MKINFNYTFQSRKVILNLFLGLLCLTNNTLLVAQSTSNQNTVAVLDFEGINVSQDEARALSNRFGSELLDPQDVPIEIKGLGTGVVNAQ